MNTHRLHYAPQMIEVSTFDQYSPRNAARLSGTRGPLGDTPSLRVATPLQLISPQCFEIQPQLSS